MRRFIIFCVAMLLISGSIFAQPPDTLWTHTFGDSLNDGGYSVQQTPDGGYIVAGYTASYGAGSSDSYLIKTDSNGDTLWTHTYGDSLSENGQSVQQTTDGGYIVAGYTNSYGAGNYDFYLIKTNSTGDTLWTSTYGGIDMERCFSVQQTTDGGYILAGDTRSYGAGNSDYYLIKTNSTGDTLWTRTYGGSEYDYGKGAQQTTDGGYIQVGESWIGGVQNDFYLVKTNSTGDTLWTRYYGGSEMEYGSSVQQTTDGGYIVAGHTNSYGSGSWDCYLIKTNSTGDTLWTRTYGGSGTDRVQSVQQTTDGGYIVAGYTNSYGAGGYDFYLIKTNSTGDTLWTRIYGGSVNDISYSVQQTTDEGYIVAGNTMSYGAGGYDIYLIRLEGQPLMITLTPHNPPIQIPAGGGNFVFDIAIENTTNSTVNFDAWTFVIFPNGIEYPLLLRPGLTLPAGGNIERELTQYIPPRALPGDYTYVGKVGTYPDVVISDDSFPFEKLADDFSGPNHNQGWAVYGWEDEVATIISPSEYVLLSVYPNPFNPGTNLTYSLTESGIATLIVFDVLGKEITHLADGWHQAGTYNVTFHASDLPSGIYFARLKSEGSSITQKLLLMK